MLCHCLFSGSRIFDLVEKMKKAKKESFFWTSYADLMTSLFFVMLVLFILVIVLLHNKMVEIEAEKAATQEQLDKIMEIEKSIENIDKEYFVYHKEKKRHTLNEKINVSFKSGSSDINDISNQQLEQLKQVGNAIIKFVDNAVSENGDVKYLLIIEGQSSKDDYERNYELSFERALALYRYWLDCSIVFDKSKCEVIISGSGQWSDFREQPDDRTNKKNQRFVIHIIPKTGEITRK